MDTGLLTAGRQMVGLGTLVNVAAIVIGGIAGLALKKILLKRFTDTVMQGLGVAVIIIGISGALSAAFKVVNGSVASDHIMLMIISLAIGAVIGEAAKIEDRLESLAKFCEKRFAKPGGASTFAQGFITTTLIFCTGSMAIVGSLEDGINMNSNILFAKSALDGITGMIFASTLGIGVLFSAVVVGIYQGLITVLAVFIAPYLDDVIVTQMSLIGSVLIMSIGFNMLHITKIKTGNLLPAIVVPVVYYILRLFL